MRMVMPMNEINAFAYLREKGPRGIWLEGIVPAGHAIRVRISRVREFPRNSMSRMSPSVKIKIIKALRDKWDMMLSPAVKVSRLLDEFRMGNVVSPPKNICMRISRITKARNI